MLEGRGKQSWGLGRGLPRGVGIPEEHVGARHWIHPHALRAWATWYILTTK